MPRGFYYIAARNAIAFATIFAFYSNERRTCFSHGLLKPQAHRFFFFLRSEDARLSVRTKLDEDEKWNVVSVFECNAPVAIKCQFDFAQLFDK